MLMGSPAAAKRRGNKRGDDILLSLPCNSSLFTEHGPPKQQQRHRMRAAGAPAHLSSP